MSRGSLTQAGADLISDNGGVLWQIVKGEQLEYPVVLNFLTNADAGYIYEAVVVEALNVGDGQIPKTAKPSGVQTTLTVRQLTNAGNWNAATAYNAEVQYVYYSTTDKYYKRRPGTGTGVVDSTPPNTSLLWEEFAPNTVYIQFPMALGSTWSPQATAEFAMYGFFELRVTEPNTFVFPKTYKPVRGLVEIPYSPTDVVP